MSVATGEYWGHGGSNFFANGLIDITSRAEAMKGHISEKVVRVGKKNAFNFPHLYDVYCDDFDVSTSKADGKKGGMEIEDEEAQAIRRKFAKKQEEQAGMAEERLNSLRSRDSMKK